MALPLGLLGQSSYYWSDGRQIPLSPNPKAAIIHFQDREVALTATRALEVHPALSTVDVFPHKQRAVLHFTEAHNESPAEVARLLGLSADNIRSITYGWQLEDGFEVFHTHEVVLQLLSGYTLEALTPIMETYEAKFVKTSFANVVLEVDHIEDVFSFANALQESGKVRFAHPDFYAEAHTSNDPLYAEQFQLNNTGQSIDFFSGVADIDCNAPEAWAISTGSAAVTVAVIDRGLSPHEDLDYSTANGYTPATGGDGTPTPAVGEAHGIACAGIIAANHNTLGIRGIAPKVELLGVNIFSGGETILDRAEAINWSASQGASILSNSWGYNSCTFAASALTTAIEDAYENGRGGLGCVIVFASGNNFRSCVSYPSSLPEVLSVGACDSYGARSYYSNYGPGLDLVAPSMSLNDFGDQASPGVRSLDLMGSDGYTSGNYVTDFGGTSAACPVVSGTAALLLSVDASLRASEVYNILRTTAKDLGPTDYDTEFGWGLVDAHAALNVANGTTSLPSCNMVVSKFPHTETFEFFQSWTQTSGDDFDWTRKSGNTPSSFTGPSAAILGSYYTYLESSFPNYPQKTAGLISPCYDFRKLSNPQMEFFTHMYGSQIGELVLEASLDGGNWHEIWRQSGNQGNIWEYHNIPLDNYAGLEGVQFRFTGVTGTGYRGDIAIDHIRVSGCKENGLLLTLAMDDDPVGISWEIRDSDGIIVASGGGYSTPWQTERESICLPNGCYDFTITDTQGNGICCYPVEDGYYSLVESNGRTISIDGLFGSSNTTSFCLGEPLSPDCPFMSFTNRLQSYSGSQDEGQDYATYQNDETIQMGQNSWAYVNQPYAITSQTMLSFDFKSTAEGEIHGIMFDVNTSLSTTDLNRIIQVYGTQTSSIQAYNTYSGSDWESYVIPVGAYYTAGTYNNIVFVTDHDAFPSNGTSFFRNVRVYEDGDCVSGFSTVTTPLEVSAVPIQHESEFDLKLYPNPASTELHLQFGFPEEEIEYPVEILDLRGKVITAVNWTSTHPTLSVETLPPGMYILNLYYEGGTVARKFLKQ